MDREAFKLRMKSLKSYRELNPGKGYWDWCNNLPDNLKNTDDYEYDMRGAYESGALSMWNENDQSYHLPSRDPKTGKILKKPGHATYWEGIATDIKEGYYPYSVGDDTYTRNPLKELAFGNYRVDALADGGVTDGLDEEAIKLMNLRLGRSVSGRPLELGLKPVITAEDIANMTPLGDVMSVAETADAIANKDWVGAGLAAIGVLPFVPSGLSRIKKSIPTEHAVKTIQNARKLPTQNPNTITSLSEVPRASQNIPTSGDKVRLKRSSRGDSRLSPEALKTIQYIRENVEPLPEFRNPMYYDAFMKHMDELNIETDIIDIGPKTLAQVLTDQYSQLTNTATGVVKNKVFGRVDPKPFTEFNWQSHLGENTHNPGFWGAGNYFATGMSKGMRPFIISDIDELAYDAAFEGGMGAGKATKWMLDNPEKRMVVSTPDGMSNKYGFINDGKDFGIEVVTLKNTGIKSLFPDFTTGNGKTFVRDWNNPNIFKALSPIIGLSAYRLFNNDDTNMDGKTNKK